MNKTGGQTWGEGIELRLAAVERVAHEPYDFTELIRRLERAEDKIVKLEALTKAQQTEIDRLRARAESAPSYTPPIYR
jgi:hypothetical protein